MQNGQNQLLLPCKIKIEIPVEKMAENESSNEKNEIYKIDEILDDSDARNELQDIFE